jgi:hypothetical protein
MLRRSDLVLAIRGYLDLLGPNEAVDIPELANVILSECEKLGERSWSLESLCAIIRSEVSALGMRGGSP